MTVVALLLAFVSAQLSGPADEKAAHGREVPGATVSIQAELSEKLLKAKRVFVESFGESEINKALEGMVIDAVRASGRFIVTENKAKADLILKGAALEKTSQEIHALGSSTAVAGAAGGSSGSIHGTPGHVTGSARGGFRAAAAAIDDSQLSTESIHETRASVRLLSLDGDVVWSTTQESKGAKYKTSTADVADKIVKQLARDLDKLK